MSEEHRLNFMTGLNRLKLFHGISMNENDYIELAFSAWDKISDKATAMYKTEETLVGTTIDLPCNYYTIEAIVSDMHCFCDARTNYSAYSNFLSKHHTKPFNGDLFNIKGNFVNYRLRNNQVVFEKEDAHRLHGHEITIYYTGILTDNDGLPYITEKQAEAISYYCAYILEHRKLMQRVGDANLVQYLKAEWFRKCNDAKVDEYMSQNSLDKILNAQTSWNRKRWNKSLIL